MGFMKDLAPLNGIGLASRLIGGRDKRKDPMTSSLANESVTPRARQPHPPFVY